MSKLLSFLLVLSVSSALIGAERYAVGQSPANKLLCFRSGVRCSYTCADCACFTCGAVVGGCAIGASVMSGSYVPLCAGALAIGSAVVIKEEFLESPEQKHIN